MRQNKKNGQRFNMLSGTVRFYNETKGYGFIKPEGGGEDAFVHATVVKRSGLERLETGQQVNYETGQGPDGRTRATEVRTQ